MKELGWQQQKRAIASFIRLRRARETFVISTAYP
jgi:hypothetical protein